MKFDPGYTDALEFHCSDQSFEELYKQCLDALLTMINHDDSQDTIDKKVDKCSRIVLSTFMGMSNLEACYNLNEVSNFHMEVVDVIKYPFKNNQFSLQIFAKIDKFYSSKPIFPILRPISVLLMQEDKEEQFMDRIQPASEGTSDPKQQAIELFTGITNIVEEYKRLLEYLPPYITWFPIVFRNYMMILDETDVEEDPITTGDYMYIEEVMDLVNSLPEDNLLSHKFYDRFDFLSSFLTKDKHNYKGFQFPTVYMCGAIVRNRYNYTLVSDHLQIWRDRYTQQKIDSFYLNSWNNIIKQRYLHLWFDRASDVKVLTEIADSSLNG
ncbi:unnamed protein product [Ambrosiozyma monospora]|uniref:Unnamed protein product n=1 Tax=Ambrosiozyma monospora TaxID=43982 RepID=A0ACB5U8G5_AMBMO|nr:unnamed protein product [Ambrosiozyma monospora]